ncbi:MAG: RpiB/LacA/LacB family sugar-phosphate isomerase [Parcubacteria group bacterium]|jgi:ribose 5-phosphate isomerase B
MKIYLGTDHAGLDLKEYIKKFLQEEMNYDVEDKGALTFNALDDYPDYIMPVAQAVAKDRLEGQESFGIIFGKTGQGEAMVANRTKGVRCAVYYGGPMDVITLSRTHNDANMLALGGRFLSDLDAKAAVNTWLSTSFLGDERHVRRLSKF